MAQSKIEWTDRSDWNPLRGCSRVSAGCVNCYAEIMAARFSRIIDNQPQWGHGYAEIVQTPSGPDHRWTGRVEVMWDRLSLPLRWKTPARIFASSTSDFFHEKLTLTECATLYGYSIAAHHLRGHTLQILTKRAARAAFMMNTEEFWEIANSTANQLVMDRTDPLDRRQGDARATLEDYGPDHPPPGIHFGTSVEDQAAALDRLPLLVETPAVVRWVSFEPLIGPVLADEWMDRIDWAVVGGESGPGARDNDFLANARSLLEQCRAAGVPFFGKQNFKKGDLPADLQIREFPNA